MMESTDAVSDKRIQRSPSSSKRSCTDVYCIFIFVLIFTLWIGSICYVNTVKHERKSYIKKPDDRSVERSLNVLRTINFPIESMLRYYSNSYSLLVWYICLPFNGIILLVYFVLLRVSSRFFTYAGLACILASAIYLLFSIVLNLVNLAAGLTDPFVACSAVVWTIGEVAALSAAAVAVYLIEVDSISDVMKRALRAMFSFSSLIFFGLLLLAVTVVLFVVTIPTLAMTRPDDPLRYVVSFGCVYVYRFLYSFGNMVVSQAIVTWHWPPDDGDITSGLMLRCIFKVCRYHLGSVALSATYIIPLLQAIYVAIKTRCKSDKKYANAFVEFALKVYLVFNVSDFADIMVSMHGCGYYAAIDKSFRLLVKYSPLSLALSKIFKVVAILGVIIPYLAMLLLPLEPDRRPIDPMVAACFGGSVLIVRFVMMIAISTVLLIPVFLTAWSSVDTTLVCNLEDVERTAELYLCKVEEKDGGERCETNV